MTNNLTPYEPAGDDGFTGSLNTGRMNRGSYLKWTDADHWVDRDGLSPPSPLLVIAISEVLQRWKDGKAEVINDKPLPDPEQLNASIPVAEWERGLDNQPRKPWSRVVVVYLVNLATGELYTYAAPTAGARIAFDALKEAVITMRALRGTKCMPVVNLSERPFKTSYGARRRPHFEIIGWKTPGDDSKTALVKPVAPQLSGSAAADTPMAPAPAQARAAATPVATTLQHQAKPKPPVHLTADTLSAMADVKPATTQEVLNDELPW
jgi:hypothetical protein